MRNISTLNIACGRASIDDKAIHSRIIKGYEVTPHSIPWQALVVISFKSGLKGRCGGSLIDSRNVLSAAHCTFDRQLLTLETDPTKFSVMLGQHQTLSGLTTDGLNVSVCRVSMHKSITSVSDFMGSTNPDKFLNNDFVILLLTNPVTFNGKISPVCLPTPNMDDKFLLNKTLTASGWGIGSETESVPSIQTLHAVKLLGVSNEMCSKAHSASDKTLPSSHPLRKQPITITKNMLCAGYLDEAKSICVGDSGGRSSPSSISINLNNNSQISMAYS